jgi:hypothetical protein
LKIELLQNGLVGIEQGALDLELLVLLDDLELTNQHDEIEDKAEHDENGG